LRYRQTYRHIDALITILHTSTEMGGGRSNKKGREKMTCIAIKIRNKYVCVGKSVVMEWPGYMTILT